ncbi:MAG: MFS transporter [Thermodesulfobacteriota bacterium]
MRQDRDVILLFATRILRLFAYGFLSVVLALYLAAIGLAEAGIGLLFSLTLAGDAVISLLITTRADRFGRRRMLLFGAALMALAGAAFLATTSPILLGLAAIIGVISPTGYEIGPFLSLEQAALSGLVPDRRRTGVFAWYNLAGSLATAAGALAGGWLAQALQAGGLPEVASFRVVLAGYCLAGLGLFILFTRLSPAVEVAPAATAGRRTLGLHRSRGTVLRLSALFALDAFAGGFIVQSMLAYWLHLRFGVAAGPLGSILFGANLLAAASALLAAGLARRFGLLNTMVFTHLPSNVMLLAVPLMPSLELTVALLLARFAICQMDVPTRQSYTMAVVEPDERAAASGVTTIARSVGAAASPLLAGLLLAQPALVGVPFFLAGGLKIVYDLALFRACRALRPPEERP